MRLAWEIAVTIDVVLLSALLLLQQRRQRRRERELLDEIDELLRSEVQRVEEELGR